MNAEMAKVFVFLVIWAVIASAIALGLCYLTRNNNKEN